MKPQLRHALEHSKYIEIYCDDNSQRRSDCSLFDAYCWLFICQVWPFSVLALEQGCLLAILFHLTSGRRKAGNHQWLAILWGALWHFNKKKMAAHGRQQINQRDSKTARGSGARTPTTSNSTTIEANFLANTSGRVNTRWVGSKCQREWLRKNAHMAFSPDKT